MRLLDLIITCIHNLFRHRGRTILTIVGVVVGCCSVVLMISFGVAMKISMNEMLASMGDLSVVEVRPKGNKKLTDSDLKKISKIKHVDSVMSTYSPSDVEITVRTADGRYLNTWPGLKGIYADDLEKFELKTYKGELIKKTQKTALF